MTDLVVVGGGAGGLSAARAAARRGADVVLVQSGRLGGDCTFTGCVPSKALLAAAARGASFADAMVTIHRAIETVAAAEDDAALAREGVDVRHGWARLRSPTEVDIDGRIVRTDRIVLATGARPAVPPIPGLRELDHLTNETLFDLPSLPPRLAVLGGGAIGCEMGQAFARLGSQVTVVEAEPRLLPREEPETSQVIATALAGDGVDVRVGSPVERVEPLGGGGAARLHLAGGATVEADRVLVAIGRRPATEGLGLEEVGVGVDRRGFIATDDTLRTTVDGVWAVGDITGRLQLTHAAGRMGLIAARNALSPLGRVLPQRFDTAAVPWAVFTSPEVGRVGMTEAEAAEVGGRVAYLPMSALDRAIAADETAGFVKLLAGPRSVLRSVGGGRMLGATVVATTGGELVHEVALAMRTRMFPGRLAQTVHAYPTWSMAIQQAAAQLFFETDGREARPARR